MAKMTEDDLLAGLADALTISGWRWLHIRRSDLAITQGMPGFPDLFAIHVERREALAWELKNDRNRVTPDQAAWLIALESLGAWDIYRINVGVVRPEHYDAALAYITEGRRFLAPRPAFV